MADKASGGLAINEPSQQDGSKGVKRQAEDDAENTAAKKQETETAHSQVHQPTDDKGTFRLNPPTLIHGVAKPAPKSDGDNSSENKEKPLLRPSLFGASSNPFLKPFSTTSSAADSTSQDTEASSKDEDSKLEQSEAEKPKVNFLKLSSGESDRDVGFGVFGTFSDSHLHKVDFSSEEEKAKRHNGEGQNYFLQFSQPNTSSVKEEKKSSTEEENKEGVSSTEKEQFVFGQNMNARVTSPAKEEGELHTAGQYVFGQNLSSRVKMIKVEIHEQTPKSLAESAKELETAKEKSKVKLEEVELITGEEGEENVLQAQCKLHLFQVETQAWVERGRGLLKLNDKVPSDYQAQMESRIVMRAQGSLRVLLNAKIWSDMIAEKVSTKNIRISAVESDSGKVRIYLITATPNDAEQIYQGIEYRIQALKHREASSGTKKEKEDGKEELYQTEDSLSNSATFDSYEGNEAEGVPEKRLKVFDEKLKILVTNSQQLKTSLSKNHSHVEQWLHHKGILSNRSAVSDICLSSEMSYFSSSGMNYFPSCSAVMQPSAVDCPSTSE
ncbi:Ran-binding protein 3 [Holothuria leucospilota]|uniref:Ran-binding protein 3 n=1 Tax=Holothuria leucospilota TaxID=206669 RepID=A0A9Q1HCG2_HOLLE|nr:Ran-binding protein 3 [Holothuria leucospilota]